MRSSSRSRQPRASRSYNPWNIIIIHIVIHRSSNDDCIIAFLFAIIEDAMFVAKSPIITRFANHRSPCRHGPHVDDLVIWCLCSELPPSARRFRDSRACLPATARHPRTRPRAARFGGFILRIGRSSSCSRGGGGGAGRFRDFRARNRGYRCGGAG